MSFPVGSGSDRAVDEHRQIPPWSLLLAQEGQKPHYDNTVYYMHHLALQQILAVNIHL